MNIPCIAVTITSLLLTGECLGQVAAKRLPPSRYSHLWASSPFTIEESKSNNDNKVVPASALDNWALSGFATIGEKKVVILLNKTKPDERVMVISGEKNERNLEVLEIDPGNAYIQARVKLRLGGSLEGWISYQPELLKLKNVPAPQAPKEQPQPQEQGRSNRGRN